MGGFLLGVIVASAVRRRRWAVEPSGEGLRQSEERYRTFLAQASEGIWRCEVERPIPVTTPVEEQIDLLFRTGFLAECNDAMARMYGHAVAADVVGKRTEELLVR